MSSRVGWAAATLGLAGLVLGGCAGASRKVSQYDLALYLQQQGKGDEALEALQRSLALDPTDPTPREALAAAYYARGWRTQAVEEWEKAYAASSDDPSFYVGDAKPSRSQAWIADGIASRQRAAAGLVKCYSAIADEAYKGARFEDAAKAAQRLTQLAPDGLAGWEVLARSLKRTKDGAGAYAAWARCAALDPKDPENFKELGFAAFGQTKLNEAEAAFRRYSALQPDDPKGYNNLGTVLALLNRFDESQAAFDQALSLQPDMVASLNGKATAYYYQKHYGQARKLWAHVLVLAPEDPTALENIRTLVKMGY